MEHKSRSGPGAPALYPQSKEAAAQLANTCAMPDVASRERNAVKAVSNTQLNGRSRSKGATGASGPESSTMVNIAQGTMNANQRGVTFDPKSVHLEATTMLGGARNTYYKPKETQSALVTHDASMGPEF